MKKIGLIVLGLFLLLVVISPKGNQSTTLSTPTANPPVATLTPVVKQYYTIIEVSGNAEKKTDSFILTGGKQKLTYTFDGGSVIVGAIYVLKEGTDLQVQGGFPEVMVSKAGSDTTILRKVTGTYYLDITSANSNWTVKLEEER